MRFLVFILIFSWIFSGWPQIGNFPPRIEEAQAAVSFIGSCENSAVGNAPSLTLTLPSMQPNDLVIIALGIADNDNTDFNLGTQLIANGYTEVVDIFVDDTYEANLGVYWKVMGGTPDATAVIDPLGGNDASNAAVCMVFRGVDTSSPMDVTPTTDTNIDAMHPTPPSIDHNNPAGVWTVIAGTSAHVLGAAGTYTFPTGYTTNAIDTGYDDTSDATTGLGYRSSGVSDPESPGTMTHSGTNATTYSSAAATMALRPVLVVVDTPVYDNGTATYNNDVSVTITVASPASSTICYTTNGDTPAAITPGTCSTGTTYSVPVSITATGTVLKAIGTKAGYANSAVQSATYTLQVGAITSIPGAGNYTSTQSVTLSIATTTSAVAHYTTDGNPVSCSSTTYTGAFDVSVTTTVKAIGCKTNYVDDTAISDLYTIGPSTAIEIVGKVADTAITTITFPEGAPSSTISTPFNDVDTVTDAQVLSGTVSEPVVRLKNTSGGTLNVTLEITTWSDGVAASEDYELVVTTDTTVAVVDNVLSADGNAASVPTGISIPGSEYKALYLKLVLSSVAAKTGNSTLTILGEG